MQPNYQNNFNNNMNNNQNQNTNYSRTSSLVLNLNANPYQSSKPRKKIHQIVPPQNPIFNNQLNRIKEVYADNFIHKKLKISQIYWHNTLMLEWTLNSLELYILVLLPLLIIIINLLKLMLIN